jgi:two-component system, OmpR family, response regulator
MQVDPLPVLVVRRGPVSSRALAAFERDERVELFYADELTPDWVALADRVAAVIMVNESDPFSALGYAITAGVTCPIVVTTARRFRPDCKDLVAAGASACLMIPARQHEIDALIPMLRLRAGPARLDATLRLLLDPISRIARYRNKVVRLSLREFAVLHCLSTQSGRPVPAETLMTYVWGDADVFEGSRKILDVYIFQLRKKLRGIGLPDAISTVRGFGYTLAAGSQSANVN